MADPDTTPPPETTTATADAPTDAIDAQIDGHVEHAEEAAAEAEKKAADLKAELEAQKAKADARTPPAAPAPGELSDAQKQQNFERASVVVTQLAEPAVPREVTEEVRLQGIKQSVKDHLRNATPDMSPYDDKPAEDSNPEGGTDPAAPVTP